jgi:molecular chaperone DnaK (HSP70)
MTNLLDSGNANTFNTPVTAVLNGVKKGLLFAFGFALVLMLQVTFFSSGAIASPLASFGGQVDKMTQGVKTDIAIDKAAGITKEIGRDLRDGRTDKVIDKLADTSKDFAKEAKNRTKDLAKNVKEGTKENMGKAKDMAKDAKNAIGDGVEKTKEMAGDRADELKANTKDLPDKAGNKVEEAIDSVKNFLGQ